MLIAMRALSAVTALPSPNTAVKNRLAVSTLDVPIASFGTGHPKLGGLMVLSARWKLTGCKICDVDKHIQYEHDKEGQGRISLHGFNWILARSSNLSGIERGLVNAP